MKLNKIIPVGFTPSPYIGENESKSQMKRCKIYKWCCLLVILFYGGFINAQQQPLHTMFMYNKLLVNPAYAGYHEHPCVNAIVREQWIGFDGAPKSQSFSIHGPLSSQRIGVGLNIQRRSIGVSSSTTVDGIYDYRLPMGNGILSLGVQASARFLKVDYNDPAVKTVQDIAIDPGVESVSDSKFLANVGAGIYYSTPSFYAGISSPRLMNSDIDFEVNNLFTAKEQAHFYLMTGIALPLTYKLSFVPQIMVRYVNPAPVSIDLNLGLRWREDYAVAVTLRKGGVDNKLLESVDLIASAKVLRGLRVGASYDFTLSDLRRYSDGSLEVMMMYCFGEPAKPSTFINPLYF
ncbi:MAG TPA: type IX secretion system membrane protein PorP/SprF [Saprospiraceae bacterium]|nr:type IX secretion system membrane protein PorP/SprF [Saprospiraceae bacterium]